VWTCGILRRSSCEADHPLAPFATPPAPIVKSGAALRSLDSALHLTLLALALIAGALVIVVLASPGARLASGVTIIGVIVAGLMTARAIRAQRILAEASDESREIQTALRASEAKFSGILAIAVDAIISVDESQRIIHFNRGAETIFGYEASEVSGSPLSMLLPDRFRSTHDRHIAGFASGMETARRMAQRREIFGLRRNGKEFPAEASISKLDLPGARLFTVVLRDISERKRIERDEHFLSEAGKVLTSSIDYEATLNSVAHLPVPYLADCCLLTIVEDDDTLQQIASVHGDAERDRALGAFATAAAGDDGPEPALAFPVSPQGDLVPDVNESWLESHVAYAGRRDLLRSLGVKSLMLVPLNAPEAPLGAMCVMSTTADRQFDEHDLDVARALAQRAAFAIENARLYRTARRATQARDEVLGVVSHDLRNPLSAIAMCARVLLTSPPPDEAGRQELLTAIYDATEWMHRLIQDLLDVAHVESGKLTIERRPTSVQTLVEQAATMFQGAAAERGIAFESSADAAAPYVDVDDVRIVQVLSNLLGNAVKFTREGGHIDLIARGDGDAVRFTVSDTGAGIPAENLPHVFRRYWTARGTTQKSGSGLGLAIAEGIVRAHGGRIWVESEVGKGTSVHFTVPATPAPEPEGGGVAAPAVASH
jgi:PAS domain S-box-containing protein